jgi:hypothetical protein
MSVLNFFSALLKRNPLTPYNVCENTIKKMGYKKDSEGCFLKENSSGRTMIWLSESGVKIKVYGGGYSESEFLPAPLPDTEKLKNFIRENEL